MLRLSFYLGPLLATLILALPLQPAVADPAEIGPDAEIAVIGGEHFTYSQLPTIQADLAENQRRYEEQLHQLSLDHARERQAIVETRVANFVDSQDMQKEAAARKMTVQDLIKEVDKPQVSDADIHAFYELHKQQLKQPFEAEVMPITEYLTKQAGEKIKSEYLAGLRTTYGARETLPPLREEVAAQGPSRGPSDARVVLVEFSDFQCPFCGKIAPVLKQVLEHYPHDVRLVYRQMPLTGLHPNALHAAEASVCAGEQGKFWEMHDALFADQKALELEDLRKMATTVGLRSKSFAACMESTKTEATVKADAQAGVDYGVNGTPGLFVNGRFLNGAIPYEKLTAVIDDELARQQTAPATTHAEAASTIRR